MSCQDVCKMKRESGPDEAVLQIRRPFWFLFQIAIIGQNQCFNRGYIHEFWGNLYANVSLLRNQKFDLISQSGWITFTRLFSLHNQLAHCKTRRYSITFPVSARADSVSDALRHFEFKFGLSAWSVVFSSCTLQRQSSFATHPPPLVEVDQAPTCSYPGCMPTASSVADSSLNLILCDEVVSMQWGYGTISSCSLGHAPPFLFLAFVI